MVEQGTHKPLVGSSTLPPGTIFRAAGPPGPPPAGSARGTPVPAARGGPLKRSGEPASRPARARLRRLEPVLRRALRGPCHVPAGRTLLVAVSGGADSTALLWALASLAREHRLQLHAAHLHHGLRGRAADADLAHVRALCATLDVPLTAARWDCAARMRSRGLSGEAGLRTLRHEWLTAVARRTGAAAIATAHTADDQLETLLLRLARGTGLAGAAGMRAQRGRWLKPLLEATRADLEADLRRARVTWREDASNASPDHARNRVRHAVVPALLDALGAPAGEPVARRAGLARRAQALARELDAAHATLARAARRAHARLVRDGQLDRTGLAPLPAPLGRLVLRRFWAQHGPQGPTAVGLTERHLAPLERALVGPRRTFQVPLPQGWCAIASGDVLRLEGPRDGSRQARPAGVRLRDRRSSPPAVPQGRAPRIVGTSGRHPRTARR